VQESIKKAISVGSLCLSGLLIPFLETGDHQVVLAVWLSLTMVATVLLFGEEEGPRLYVRETTDTYLLAWANGVGEGRLLSPSEDHNSLADPNKTAARRRAIYMRA
jgi:hypothetical protein